MPTTTPQSTSRSIPRKYKPLFFLFAVAAMFLFALVGQSLSTGHFIRAAIACGAALAVVGCAFAWRARLLR
ncbi:MAG: hypothetical protein QJR06_05275 [Alicyclobacillaceae bacterium]|nr:hypothetical protein [Alicyclobacillaceae bacterium]